MPGPPHPGGVGTAETKGKQNKKLAAEIGDPTRRVAFLREKIEAVRDGLIKTHNKAFPTAGLKYSPAAGGINRAIDDLSELMDLSDMADHLATTKPQDDD